jgi:hypothetical protein
VNVSDASRVLGRSAYQVREYVRRGLLPASKDGKGWDIAEVDLRSFLRARRERGANAPMRELMSRGMA